MKFIQRNKNSLTALAIIVGVSVVLYGQARTGHKNDCSAIKEGRLPAITAKCDKP